MSKREAVAIFKDEDEMQDVIEELESSGFDRAELSVMSSVDEEGQKAGHIIHPVEDERYNPEIPRSSHLDVASWGDAKGVLIGAPLYAGAFAMAIAGAVNRLDLVSIILLVIAGGAVGASVGFFLSAWIKSRHQEQVDEQIEQGGLVLWINIRDQKHEERVKDIISRHTTRNFHLHDIALSP